MLLQNLISSFIVMESEVDEVVKLVENPEEYVVRIAQEKALSVGRKMVDNNPEEMVVIAADTVVVDDDLLLGKPEDAQHAKWILEKLKGKTHQVLSAIVLYQPISQNLDFKLVDTPVTMREYSNQEIQDYIMSGDPFDKAGAYAIQNELFNPAPEFKDCYANVMGLPLCHLHCLMVETELNVEDGIADRCQTAIDYNCPVYPQILAGAEK
jgi:septum formation protein